MIREALTEVAENFLAAKQDPIARHPLANYLRHTAPEAVAEAVAQDILFYKGSPGQPPNWAEAPWIGIFNPEVTTTAQREYYIVYLFAADMRRVYLCLGQGVTGVYEEFGRGGKQELQRRAQLIRARVPEYRRRFTADPIALNGHTPLARQYEAGPAFSKAYEIGRLPSEDSLIEDLREMIHLYLLATARGGRDPLPEQKSTDEEAIPKDIHEKRHYARHRRIERNSKASKEAKRVHGYLCQICGFNFEKVYGELGKAFIEAHHLIPLSGLPENKPIAMDPAKDFAVLCSNCHRMLHRTNPPQTIDEVRSLPGLKSLRNSDDKGRCH